MMEHILEFHDEELGVLFIEIEEKSQGWRDIADPGDEIVKMSGKLENVLESLRTFGIAVKRSVESLNPNEIEVKAGLKLEISQGTLIGLLAKAKSEFPFEVTLKWTFNENEPK